MHTDPISKLRQVSDRSLPIMRNGRACSPNKMEVVQP
jgi:hypothetical protein